MYCAKCGTLLPENASMCPNCGTSVVDNSQSGASVFYPTQQPQNSPVYQQPPAADKSNIWLNVLSFFVPIFGIIWYFVKREKKPKEAKGTLKTAIVGVAVNFAIILLGFIFVFVGTGLVLGGMESAVPETTVASVENPVFSPQVPNAETAEDLYRLSISGQNIQLPIELTAFENTTGFRVKDSESNPYDIVLQPGEHKTVTEKHYQGTEVFLDIFNNSSSPKALGYCTVGGISQYANSGNPITFANGIQVGQHMTKSDAVSVFGAPSDLTESDGYVRLTYYEDYDQYASKRMFVITLENGVVTEIITQKRI